ncbi:hypothetical protein K3495_g13332 [Podosphaera aphanis]|nr:hypothetical protein K3495_g13332 [Podosphaera aphanis]
MNPHVPPRTSRYSTRLNRDQRIRVIVLYQAGHTNREIADLLKITINQVRNTIRSGRSSPGKSTGRPPVLTPAQEEELVTFVRSSQENRQMSYLELAMNFHTWNVGEDAIRNALKRRGVSRHTARSKALPPNEHTKLRLE